MLNKIYRFFYPGRDPVEIRRRYDIPDNIEFQWEMHADGYIVITSEQLPGFIAEAKNSSEIIDAFNEAILVYFDVPKKYGDIVFPELNIAGFGTVSYKNKNKFQLA